MPGGRPEGPLRSYTVLCAWPSSPKRFRTTVESVDERTARESVIALRKMHFAVQVDIAFRASNRTNEYRGACPAVRWDQAGRVTHRHTGEFQKYIPAWITGEEPVEREKRSEPVP